MLLHLKLAWRNIFRNKRRTFIAGTAIGIGLAALVFVDALMLGMEENMIASATSSFLGEGQIHRKGFRNTQEAELTINNLDSVTARLRRSDIVERWTLRTLAFAMLTSPANVCAVEMVGLDPATERYLSEIDDGVVVGSYFAGDNPRDIVIGRKLAEVLEVDLDDRVVLTTGQAKTGDLAQEMFRVSGIYRTGVDELDRGLACVRLRKAQEMLGLDGQAHEIAIVFTDRSVGRDRQHSFWGSFSTGGNEALGWVGLMPTLEAIFAMIKVMMVLVGLILFGVVALGIINTLFMSLYERMFEFGVLRAVGTRPVAMGRLIVFEAAALAVVSIILGLILGYVVTGVVASTGLDYTGIEIEGVTFRELLYPRLQLHQFVLYPVAVFVTTMLVGLYPAVVAARVLPVQAMRRGA